MISVVICAHTEKRWQETCAAVESVRAQSYPDKEIIRGRRPQPGSLRLARQRAARRARWSRTVRNEDCPAARTPASAVAQGDDCRVPRRRRGGRPGLAEVLCRLLRRSRRHGRRRPHAAHLEGPAPVLVPPGVRLGRRLHLPSACRNPAHRSGTCSAETPPSAARPSRIAGGFQNGIGRSAGKRPLGCEETEFCIRLNQQSPRFGVPVRRPGDDLAPGPGRAQPVLLLPRPAATPKACPRRWSPPASAPSTGSPRNGGTRPERCPPE